MAEGWPPEYRERPERIIRLIELGCEHVSADRRGLLVSGILIGPNCWKPADGGAWRRYQDLAEVVAAEGIMMWTKAQLKELPRLRAEYIVRLRKDGLSFRQIGLRINRSHEHARQIFYRATGETPTPQGATWPSERVVRADRQRDRGGAATTVMKIPRRCPFSCAGVRAGASSARQNPRLRR
jgi:hypothetical protein